IEADLLPGRGKQLAKTTARRQRRYDQRTQMVAGLGPEPLFFAWFESTLPGVLPFRHLDDGLIPALEGRLRDIPFFDGPRTHVAQACKEPVNTHFPALESRSALCRSSKAERLLSQRGSRRASLHLACLLFECDGPRESLG